MKLANSCMRVLLLLQLYKINGLIIVSFSNCRCISCVCVINYVSDTTVARAYTHTWERRFFHVVGSEVFNNLVLWSVPSKI